MFPFSRDHVFCFCKVTKSNDCLVDIQYAVDAWFSNFEVLDRSYLFHVYLLSKWKDCHKNESHCPATASPSRTWVITANLDYWGSWSGCSHGDPGGQLSSFFTSSHLIFHQVFLLNISTVCLPPSSSLPLLSSKPLLPDYTLAVWMPSTLPQHLQLSVTHFSRGIFLKNLFIGFQSVSSTTM